MNLAMENIVNVLKEVSLIDIGDNVTFEYQNINEIRQDDEYGGYNIVLLGKLENIKETISIDVATGDPITPSAMDYRYKCLFDEEILSFKAYNFETILAEKLQTILFRGIANSRSKDFYDIFIIYKLRWNDIDTKVLKEAFVNTCNYRGTVFAKDEALRIVDRIKNDSQMESRWKTYSKRNQFAKNIEFKDTLNPLETIIEELVFG